MSKLLSSILSQDDTPVPDDQEQVDQLEKKTNTSSISQQELCYDLDREDRDERKIFRINDTLENDVNNRVNGNIHKTHALYESEFEKVKERDRSSSRVSQVIVAKDADSGSRASIQSQTGKIIPKDKNGKDSESDSEKVRVNADKISQNGFVNQKSNQADCIDADRKGNDHEDYEKARNTFDEHNENEQARTTFKIKGQQSIELEYQNSGKTEMSFRESDLSGEPTGGQIEEEVKHKKDTDGKREDNIDMGRMRDNLPHISPDWREQAKENDLDIERNDDNDLNMMNTSEKEGKEGVEGSQRSMKEDKTINQRKIKSGNDSERNIATDMREGNKDAVKPDTPSDDLNRQGEIEVDSGSERGIIGTFTRENANYSTANIPDLTCNTKSEISGEDNLEGVNEAESERTFGIAEDQQRKESKINDNKDPNSGDDGFRGMQTKTIHTSASNTDENVQVNHGDQDLRKTRNDGEYDGSNMEPSPTDKEIIQDGTITQVVNSIRSEYKKENNFVEDDEGKASRSGDASRYSRGKKESRRDEKDNISDSHDTKVEQIDKENAKSDDTGKYGVKYPRLNEEAKEKDGEDNVLLPHVETDDSREHNEEKDGEAEEKEGDEHANQEGQGGSDGIASDSDEEIPIPEQRRLKMIVKKDRPTYRLLPKGPLTTTLMSREEEERKRQGKGYDKLRKRGKTKLKYRIGRGENNRGSESGCCHYEEEGCRIGGALIAPFTKQYKHKKHIEHVLEEENYWSDEEPKNKANYFKDHCTLQPSSASGLRVDEEVGLWPYSTDKKTESDAQGDSHINHSDAINRHEAHDSDIGETVKGTERHGTSHSKDMIKAKWNNNESEIHDCSGKGMVPLYEELQGFHDDLDVIDSSKNGLALINIKELRRGKRKENKRTRNVGEESDQSFSTETDSGVENLDVQLTNDQQKFILKSLHDELGNLRSEFDRNEEGKIIGEETNEIFNPNGSRYTLFFQCKLSTGCNDKIDIIKRIIHERKSNGAIVFDPCTGKIGIRRKRGRLFSIPRLKRNKQGRPIGGYHDDTFGPAKQDEEEAEIAAMDGSIDNNNISGKRATSSMRYSRGRSALDLKKEDTITAKTVVFDVPDEVEAMSIDNSELSELRMRGRRDITSAMRRKLRDRLFTKLKERGGAAPNNLPMGCETKQVWVQSDPNTVQVKMETDERCGVGGGSFLLNSSFRVCGQQSSSGIHATGPYHRSFLDPKQQKMFQQGLETDRQILHILNEQTMRMNEHKMRTGDDTYYDRHDHAASEMEDEDFDENWYPQHLPTDTYRRSSTYLSDDGRLIVREKGCPDLKPSTAFTWSQPTGGKGVSKQNPSSVSARLQNDHSRVMESDNSLLQDREGDKYIQNLTARSTDLNLTSLNPDYRLRFLLEELFRDKKYFDHLIGTTESKSDTLMRTKGIAEHGREFLLERADFWENRGPLPPRPSLTHYGFRKSRAQTSFREDITSTSTFTPDLRPHTMPTTLPGSVNNARQSRKDNLQETGKNENESYVLI